MRGALTGRSTSRSDPRPHPGGKLLFASSPAARPSIAVTTSLSAASSSTPFNSRNTPSSRKRRACCRRGTERSQVRDRMRRPAPRDRPRVLGTPVRGRAKAASSPCSSRSPGMPPCSRVRSNCTASTTRRSIHRGSYAAAPPATWPALAGRCGSARRPCRRWRAPPRPRVVGGEQDAALRLDREDGVAAERCSRSAMSFGSVALIEPPARRSLSPRVMVLLRFVPR